MSLSGIKTTPTIDQVIQWFHPLDGEVERLLKSQGVLPHINNLTKYYDSNVATKWSTWTRLYADCLTDIGRNPNDPDKLKIMSETFIKESGKNETQLNEMTKEKFVKLFATTMDKIIKDGEKKKLESINEINIQKDNDYKIQEENRRQRIKDYCEKLPHFCKRDDDGNLTADIDFGGGKSKKSKKKSRKRNASKRRNRRTHNYKKK
jgi:hypothetical protein